MNISTKQKQRHKHRQQMYGHQVGKGGGWDERKDWVDIYIYFSLYMCHPSPPAEMQAS